MVPVTVNGDALGALEMRLPARPDEQALLLIEAVAHALAYIVVVNRRYTDLFERGQRTAPMSLAAEIQRRLLPSSFTHEAPPVHRGRLVGAGDHGRRRHLRLRRSTTACCTCRSPTRSATT